MQYSLSANILSLTLHIYDPLEQSDSARLHHISITRSRPHKLQVMQGLVSRQALVQEPVDEGHSSIGRAWHCSLQQSTNQIHVGCGCEAPEQK